MDFTLDVSRKRRDLLVCIAAAPSSHITSLLSQHARRSPLALQVTLVLSPPSFTFFVTVASPFSLSVVLMASSIFRQLVRLAANRFTRSPSLSASSSLARHASSATPASSARRSPPASSFATTSSPTASSSAPSSSSSAGAYPTNPFVSFPAVYGGFKVHKSRAALTISFLRPLVCVVTPRSALSQPYYRLERAGALQFDFAPAATDAPDSAATAAGSNARAYNWRDKVVMSLSVTEIGDLLAFSSLPAVAEIKFFHDPQLGTEAAGETRKELIIKRAGMGKGYYFNLSVNMKGAGKSVVQVPVSDGEMAVLVELCKQSVPQLLCMAHLPPRIEETVEGQ